MKEPVAFVSMVKGERRGSRIGVRVMTAEEMPFLVSASNTFPSKETPGGRVSVTLMSSSKTEIS